jgi:predicted dehydrogenase
VTAPLRVAVVGVGVMGTYHANLYSVLPDTQLVGVVDPDPRRRREAEERYRCAVYPDVDALLARVHVDAASVAAPTSTHHMLVRQLLTAGVHVLVEKPVATDVGQALDLGGCRTRPVWSCRSATSRASSGRWSG